MESSPFMRLSGELRNAIYEFVLLEPDTTPSSIPLRPSTVDLEQTSFDAPFRRCKAIQPPWIGVFEPLRLTGLPLTCKQIRAECLRLYFSINRFCFETEYLKSSGQEQMKIVGRLSEWMSKIGHQQAREIRDVTLSLDSLKRGVLKRRPDGEGEAQTVINWKHMKLIRSFFHPQGVMRVRFYLYGNGTVSFVLGRREDMAAQLERMVELWCWKWQKVRKYSPEEARRVAERYRAEVERLFEGMPAYV